MRSWFMTKSGTWEPVQDLNGRYHPDYIRDQLPPEIYASCVAVARSLSKALNQPFSELLRDAMDYEYKQMYETMPSGWFDYSY